MIYNAVCKFQLNSILFIWVKTERSVSMNTILEENISEIQEIDGIPMLADWMPSEENLPPT